MSAKVTGIKEIKRAMKKAQVTVDLAVAAGVFAVGNEIMTDSKRMVPVDLGALKGSGYVTQPEIELGVSARVELGYGGPAKDYAVIQHEETSFVHPEGGEAKFLEKAVNAHAGTAPARIAQIVKRQLRKNGAPNMPKVHPENPDSGA